ncbi:Paxillin [Orchesella cincta]|uniref:Paxillin n=1 Tax=Orchesella cincta TaxID=48709 RepID=A0A1D2NC79_ORCCI|nr:Paxillin [Orchesella cincta]
MYCSDESDPSSSFHLLGELASLSFVKVEQKELYVNSDFFRVLKQIKDRQESHQTQQPKKAHQLDSMLGNLQASMDKQGVSATQKGFVPLVVTALGKTWHPEHFTCAHCRQELGSKNFYEREGQPYCEDDYHKLYSPRCAYCNGPILDKCVTALDTNWHPEHFFCAHCGKQFGQEGFHEKDGKPYCRSDYLSLFAPKCGGCTKPITDNYITALNAQWHPECFVCRTVNVHSLDILLHGGCEASVSQMTVASHSKEDHFSITKASRIVKLTTMPNVELCAAGCHKPISGRCITAMSENSIRNTLSAPSA